jgi:hypothetical protein
VEDLRRRQSTSNQDKPASGPSFNRGPPEHEAGSVAICSIQTCNLSVAGDMGSEPHREGRCAKDLTTCLKPFNLACKRLDRLEARPLILVVVFFLSF